MKLWREAVRAENDRKGAWNNKHFQKIPLNFILNLISMRKKEILEYLIIKPGTCVENSHIPRLIIKLN